MDEAIPTNALCPDKVIEATNDCARSKPILIPGKRGYTPVAAERAIWRRAKGQCEFVSTEGVRCKSQFALQIDHCTPVSQFKSESTPGRLLCRSHNLQQAVEIIGRSVMCRYVPGFI